MSTLIIQIFRFFIFDCTQLGNRAFDLGGSIDLDAGLFPGPSQMVQQALKRINLIHCTNNRLHIRSRYCIAVLLICTLSYVCRLTR